MKRAAGTIFMLFLLALLSGMLTMALAAENDEEALAIPEPGEAAELETIEVSGTVDLFQCGSLTGNYTRPGEVDLFTDEDTIEQQIYDQIYEGLLAQQESITITRTDLAVTQENLDGLFQLVIESYEIVINDNPRFFYVSNGYGATSRGDSATGLQVILTPSYLASVTADQITAFNQAVEEAKAQVAGFTDDVEKLLILHDYLVEKNAYNWEVATTGASDDELVWSAYAALVQGDPVCMGYALAYKLLLNELGIECITVSSVPMNHMWNMVQIDGSWYHVDVTWDDPAPNTEGRCKHTYFLRADSGLSGHYSWEEDAPACTSATFESGWVFNASTGPIYLRNGEIYYLNVVYTLYKTSALNDEGTPVTALVGGFNSAYGIVWLNDYVYYVPYTTTGEQRTVKACSLDSGEITEIGTFDFTPTAVSSYTADDDFIGLRYNAATNKIEAVSSTRREVLYTAAVLEDPEEEEPSGPAPLAAPTELQWGKFYDRNADQWTVIPGAISWKSTDGVNFQIQLFRVGEETAVLTSDIRFSAADTPYFSTTPFQWGNDVFTSGTYYFTVTARGDGETCADSETVCSDTWVYIRPDVLLEVTDPAWGEKGAFTWTNLFADETLVDHYVVSVYYSATENSEPVRVIGYWYEPGYSAPSLYSDLVERNGAGYYSFSVQIYSNDVTKALNGSESERSDALYINPVKLEVTNPAWGGNGTMTWTNQFTDETFVDFYLLNIYYSNMEYGVPERIRGMSYVPGNPTQSLTSNITETYGTGYYYFSVRAFSNDVTKALNGTESALSGAYHYIAPPKLSTPTELEWGKVCRFTYDEAGEVISTSWVEQPGAISWNLGELSQNQYSISLYQVGEDGTDSYIGGTMYILSSDYTADYFSTYTFICDIEESGTYYFTVQAWGDGINYSSSDVATSPMWKYTKPNAQLDAPTNPTWDGRYMTWTPLSDTAYVYGYETEILFGETESAEPAVIGGTLSGSASRYQTYLTDVRLERYGDGYYYFRVRTISNDITVTCNSEWTELSKAYIQTEVSETVKDQLQSIVGTLPENPGEQQIQNAIDSVKAINTDQLSAAMAADKENSDTVALIEQLDTMSGVTAKIDVSEDMLNGIDPDKVSVVGACLNAAEASSGTVTLNIGKPTDGVVIPELYNDALQFSMHLEGATDVDPSTTGNQELAVPVKITLPIPANINPAFLVVLHHHTATDEWEEVLPHVYCEGGQWYATFVVTSFSDFAICEAIAAEKTDTGVSVTIDLAVEQTEAAICAVYDEAGKLLGVAGLNLTGGAQTVEIACAADQAATVKVFILDKNNAPLYQAGEALVKPQAA